MPDHVADFVTKNLKWPQNSGMVVIRLHHIGLFRSCQMIFKKYQAPKKQRETRTSQSEEPTPFMMMWEIDN